jgi:hypothetical protein
MDNEILMCIVHRVTDNAEELQAFDDAEPSLIAVLVYRLTLDVFHNEIGQTIRRRAAIQQACDVRVVESSQNLTLSLKMAQEIEAPSGRSDYLHRHVLLKCVVIPGGQIYGSHPAGADASLQKILTDAPTFQPLAGQRVRGLRFRCDGPERCKSRIINRPCGLSFGAQHLQYLCAQFQVLAGCADDELLAFGRRSFQRGLEQIPDLLKSFRSQVASFF